MFPLVKRKIGGYTFGQPTFYHTKHSGTDYEANYVQFKIPFDGIAQRFVEYGGGNWLRITRPNGERIELAHLSQWSIPNGKVKEGQIGGITGNSGAYTTNPHLHIQIRDKFGKLIDPDKYQWNTFEQLSQDYMLRTYNKTIYALVAGYWIAIGTTYEEYLADFGGQIAPAMTEAQFKAFPVNKRVIK